MNIWQKVRTLFQSDMQLRQDTMTLRIKIKTPSRKILRRRLIIYSCYAKSVK